MDAGDTFIFVERAVDSHRHLWAIISDPLVDVADPIVIVSFTSYRQGKDPTCILQAGDHAFIKRPTAVDYGRGMEVSNSALEACANTGKLVLQGPLQPHLLERIREGAATSQFTPEGCRKILARQGIIE